MYNKVQKKKTLRHAIASILFKILVAIAVIIFTYIIYNKTASSTNKLDFSNKKVDKQTSSNAPSELKWFDSFKGVENIPNKNEKKSSNTGFSYEGFKK